MGYPKFIYTGPTTVTIDQMPIGYKVTARHKKITNVTDGGIVETDLYHNRDIYYLRFEMLTTTEKNNILTMWASVADGSDFDWYLDRDAAKTADVIWNPNEDEPQIEPHPDNPTEFWNWTVELWELIT
jgi:hypothetical protein